MRSRTPGPLTSAHDPLNRPGMAVTPAQLRTLAETALHGKMPAAARCMGVSEQTAKNQLYGIRHRLEVSTTIQALAALGWLQIPYDHEVIDD